MATRAELKEKLDEKYINYRSKATIAELEALLAMSLPEIDPPKESDVPKEAVSGGDRDSTLEPVRVRVQKHTEWPQDHVLIKVSVTTMDGKTSSRQKIIANPEGCVLPRSQANNAEGYFTTLFGGLIKKYGAGHVK